MKTAILVLAWNGGRYLRNCLTSLEKLQSPDFELICVDNGSTDDSIEVIQGSSLSATVIENSQNLGFAGGMNTGLKHLLAREARPEIVVLLNQDTTVQADWLQNILAPFDGDSAIAAVGCKIHYLGSNRLQHAGAEIDPVRGITRHIGCEEIDRGQYDEAADMSYVTGAALALRTSALEAVGLFDTGFHPAYYEEVDLCLRLRQADFLVRYQPSAVVSHRESSSISDAYQRGYLTERNRLRYVVKNFSSEQLWNAFLPAELEHLDQLGHNLELATLRRAYLDAILDATEWIRARRDQHDVTASETAQLEKLGGLLRRRIGANDATRPW